MILERCLLIFKMLGFVTRLYNKYKYNKKANMLTCKFRCTIILEYHCSKKKKERKLKYVLFHRGKGSCHLIAEWVY